jgi:hypothetical protein
VGSEWEPIKILPEGWKLGLCPKFTTKDSHTSLLRSRSHKGTTNPRNKPQPKATRKRNSRSSRLSLLRSLGWTFRGDRADGPLGTREQSTRPWWTVCKSSPSNQYCTSKYGRSVPYPHMVYEELVPHGRSETGADGPQTAYNKNLVATQIKTSLIQELRNRWQTRVLADCPPTKRRQSIRHGQSCSSTKMRSQPLLSIHGSPKPLDLLRKDLGEMWSVPRGWCAPKFEPSNELNRRESNHNRSLPKS